VITPYRFFYVHAGFSWDAKKETREQGRRRNTKALADAEAKALARGFGYLWELDGMTNREWTEEGPVYGTWACVCVDDDGTRLSSLSGIDFGPDEYGPNGPYVRVVQAELALEALATDRARRKEAIEARRREQSRMRAGRIKFCVLSALQQADEIGGPEYPEYIELMEEVSKYCAESATNAKATRGKSE
jgi:hypothetical protein